jgi:sulfopyruvate decarboxylase TPP-binding subunit
MTRVDEMLAEFHACGVTHFVCLPDTESKDFYDAIAGQTDICVVPVCREGEAFAIAAGLSVTGKRPVVQIQNTGFFESGDSVRGFCLDVPLPLLLMIGYRGYRPEGTPMRDSAAVYLEPVLRAYGIPYFLLRPEDSAQVISQAYGQAVEHKCTVAVLVTGDSE